MNDQNIQDLFYLVHDKSHIIKPGTVSPEVESLIKTFRTPQTKTLYRGLCNQDVEFLDSMVTEGAAFKTFPGCLSFSEDGVIALKFAAGYKTDAILRVDCHEVENPPLGLDVCGALSKYVNRNDSGEMEMLELAQEESEWIFVRPRIFAFTKKKYPGGLTAYNAEIVTL